jgi:MoaA/NifB/PqqE/SkfB family radical SAM enzyme
LNDLYSNLSDTFPFIFKRSPLLLKVRITSKCNLSCSFCYLKDGLNRVETNVLTISEWKKILSTLPKRTIIDITGAEPMASSQIKEFIALLNEYKFKYSITTNGTLYNKETAEFLVKNNLSVLMLSLDGLEDTHNHLRGNDKAFRRTIDFIKEIKKAKLKYNQKNPLINVKATVLDENHNELNELVDFCNNELEVDLFGLTLLFQNKARGGVDLFNDLQSPELNQGNYAKYSNPEDILQSLNKIFSREKSFRFPVIIKPRIKREHIKDYVTSPSKLNVNSCPQYKNNLTLYYDGNLSPCDIALELGNIRDHDYRLDKVLNSKKFNKFKNSMIKGHPSCQGCCSGKHSP